MNIIKRILSRPSKPEPIEPEPEMQEDVYVMSLAEVLLRLDPDEEDDTANFYIQEELIGE